MKPSARTEKPILIGGYMHSGTTVIMRILSNSPDVYCRRWESRVISNLDAIERRFPNLSDDQVNRDYVSYLINIIFNGPNLGGARDLKGEVHQVTEELVDEVAAMIGAHSDHAVVFRRVFDALAVRDSKPRWLEKTPGNIFHVDRILGAIPDAYIVNVVRDPRDIIASKKIRRQRVSNAGDEMPPQLRRERQLAVGYDPILDSLAWKSAARVGRLAAARYPNRVVTIKYEDVASDPSATVQTLCAFLELDFSPSMLSVSAHGSAEGGTGSADGLGVQGDRVERWRRKLSEAEISVCQLVSEPEMSVAGYSRTDSSLSSMVKLPLLGMRSCIDLVRRLYRKYRLGGWAYIRNVARSWMRRAATLMSRVSP